MIRSTAPVQACAREEDAALRRRVGGWALAPLLAANVAQATWAERIGVSKSFAKRWLAGAQPLPVEALVRSAVAFPEVTLNVVRELAALVGMELRPVESTGAACDLTTVIREVLDVARVANDGESDGTLSPDDCDREIREWEELDRVSAARKAHLRRVKAERGAVVRIGSR